MSKTVTRYWNYTAPPEINGEKLTLRFLPDIFDHDHPTPVLRVEIDHVEEPELLGKKLRAFENDVAMEVEVDETSVRAFFDISVFDPKDDFVVKGVVAWQKEPYTIADFDAALKRSKQAWQEQERKINELWRTVSDTVNYIDRTIDRIEKKQRLTHDEDGHFKQQITLLRGVRRHLRDGE